MKSLVILLFALTTAACAPKVITKYETEQIVITRQCQEVEPIRPSMPTEALVAGSSLDTFVKASVAENIIREGYEEQLRVALSNCTSHDSTKAPK